MCRPWIRRFSRIQATVPLPLLREVPSRIFPTIEMQMGAPKKIDCFFCGRHGIRAREHVFAKTWLDELQAGQERIVLDRRSFEDDTLEDTRKHRYDSLTCGDVCGSCNSGWMSDLEGAIKPWIVGIKEKADLSSLQGPPRRLTFSRWALKTACVIDRIEGMFEIPAHIPRQLTELREAVPQYVHVLAGWQPYEGRALFSLSQRNKWIKYPREASEPGPAPLPSEGWFKVAFSIGCLLVLVAGVPSADYQLVVGTGGIHVPIWPSTKVVCHHFYYPLRLDGLDPSAALEKFSDLLAVSYKGRMR